MFHPRYGLQDRPMSSTGHRENPSDTRTVGWVSYVITVNGPEAIEYLQSPIDYQHYINKQLKPVAEGILPFIGLDFSRLTDDQLGLF